jgi:uncharacterized protein (DUF302 family)
MSFRINGFLSALILTFVLVFTQSQLAGAGDDGILRVRSAYPIGDTVVRLKKDIAEKGIMFFNEIDQAKLAAQSGVSVRPSVLLVFGNPPLGTQFISSKATAGLDWPVRLLVFENEKGEVWMAYTDFGWIARRHGITDRDAQFQMASKVVVSITSSAKAKQ